MKEREGMEVTRIRGSRESQESRKLMTPKQASSLKDRAYLPFMPQA